MITLASALVNSTPGGLVGAAWYGWPLAWMYNLVTYPPATTFSYTNLAADIVAWFIVSLAVIYLAWGRKGAKI